LAGGSPDRAVDGDFWFTNPASVALERAFDLVGRSDFKVWHSRKSMSK
jgi:hypothetical protein